MQYKRINRDRVAVTLILIGIFAAGAVLGAVLAMILLPTNTETSAPAAVSITEPESLTPDETIDHPELDEINAEPETINLGEFKLTAYCPCEKCCGQWADGITATGAKATPNRTIAVDPEQIPLGSNVFINGASYIAEDIGGAIKDNRIDIFFPTHDAAVEFGVQYAEVEILK